MRTSNSSKVVGQLHHKRGLVLGTCVNRSERLPNQASSVFFQAPLARLVQFGRSKLSPKNPAYFWLLVHLNKWQLHARKVLCVFTSVL